MTYIKSHWALSEGPHVQLNVVKSQGPWLLENFLFLLFSLEKLYNKYIEWHFLKQHDKIFLALSTKEESKNL